MRNLLIVLAGVLAVIIAVLSIYLSPDDLRSCQTVDQSSGRCGKADVIVAVSGGNTPIRAAEAIRLYKEGWAETLMFSGAAADTSGPSNAEVMRRQAIDAGVPPENIVIEDDARTTKQNAERTKELLTEAGGGETQRVILVTSGYHQRRASLEFRELAGGTITVLSHPAPNDPDWPLLWWLTPRGWWLASGEVAKIIAFYAGQSQ